MPDQPRAAESRDLATLFDVLKHRGWIVLACIVAAGATAYVYAKQQSPRYEASTNLILRDTAPASGPSNQQFGTPTPKTAPDREALILAEPVKARAVKALAPKLGGAASARQAVNDVEASSGTESGVVRITGKASTGTVAALTANTIAEENIAYRKARALGRIRRAQRVAQRGLDRLGSIGTDPQKIQAAAPIRQSLQSLKQAASVQDGDAEVLQRATTPSSPASPKPERSALIGGFAGLLLGLALTLVREQLDRRVKGATDLRDIFGLPVLANVPTSRALAVRAGKDDTRGTALKALPAAEREAFQMLRANLRFINVDRDLHSVVVTSAASGDGKTTVALNLAKADASIGRKVLLIEADMRRPSIAKLLGISATEGLAHYLREPDAQLEDIAVSVPVTAGTDGAMPLSMDVIVSGSIPENPSELINSKRMSQLIGDAGHRYELVVIDTSPVGIVADAIPLMSEASAVIIVSRVGRITSVEAQALREQLERIDAPAFGLVANFAGGRDKGYGYY